MIMFPVELQGNICMRDESVQKGPECWAIVICLEDAIKLPSPNSR